MPLIENDVIFAYLNKFDSHHKTAEGIFKKMGGLGLASLQLAS